MSSRPPRYCSYLLRCWQEPAAQPDGAAHWRFSLEDPQTGERVAFAELERLIGFLRQGIEGLEAEPNVGLARPADQRRE
jgi:hypothetical protein